MTRLVNACLDYDMDDDVLTSQATDMHPLLVLANSRHSLVALQVTAFRGVLPPELYPAPFPHARSLTIADRSFPLLGPYVHAFPNLRQLDIPEFEGSFPIFGQDQTSIHEQNRKELRRLGAWKLSSASGVLDKLYLSGLACEIQDLIVFMESFATYEMLGRLLDDSRPTKFYLRTVQPGVLQENTGLPALLRSGGGGQLAEVELQVEFSPDDKDIDLEAGLVSRMHVGADRHVR